MTTDQPLEIYGFWRSNAMYRVRVALNLKGIPFREIPVDLDIGEQFAPDFLARNPQGAVPALVDGDLPPLTQSLALLEYLEERFPAPPLLPSDLRARARVRALACNVACDIHPLIVPRVRKALSRETGMDAEGFRRWLRQWVEHGMAGLEANLATSQETGRFCHGDTITIADICVVGLAQIGRIFKLDLPHPPVLGGIVARCLAEPAFVRADPLTQPGAPQPA